MHGILRNKRKRAAFTAFLAAGQVLFSAIGLKLRRLKRFIGRRWWVHPDNKERPELGAFETVFLKRKRTDHERFFKLTRLSVQQFEELLNLVQDDLQKQSFREYLTPEFRLAFTLCYLASGTTVVAMVPYWRIGKSTGYEIIKETSEAIWQRLKDIYLAQPSLEDWKKITDGFWIRWNFPNCCGAIDGKHIRIQCPPKTGSQFFNYKQFFSFVLMAVCDCNYCFTLVDLGDFGSLPDSSVFSECNIAKDIDDGSLKLPEPTELPETNTIIPHFFVGDEGFPLREDIMRPYSRRALQGDAQRVFNYRLSRARLTIENAFGVLSSRWRVLRTTIAMKPENAEKIVLAAICLHNFIMKREEHIQGFKQYCPPTYVDREDEHGNWLQGDWRNEPPPANFLDIGRLGANRGGTAAIRARDTLAQYFLTEPGFVPWQYHSAFRGFDVNIP